jgi:hypothetical protein
MPEVAAVVPEVGDDVPEVVAVVQEVAAEYENEASASNVSADADELLPPPPAFSVPPMEWLLGGPSAGWLVDDPERDFSDEELAAPPPPPVYYYMLHGSLPSPTPSDEEPEHFAPPGYAPVTQFFELPVVAPVDALPPGLATNLQPEVKKEKAEDMTQLAAFPTPSPEAARARVVPALPDLNLPAPDEKGKAEDTAPPAALPTPSPEARLLLRRFAGAMAARPAGIRAGTWSPVKLGLTNPEGGLRLHEPSTETSQH